VKYLSSRGFRACPFCCFKKFWISICCLKKVFSSLDSAQAPSLIQLYRSGDLCIALAFFHECAILQRYRTAGWEENVSIRASPPSVWRPDFFMQQNMDEVSDQVLNTLFSDSSFRIQHTLVTFVLLTVLVSLSYILLFYFTSCLRLRVNHQQCKDAWHINTALYRTMGSSSCRVVSQLIHRVAHSKVATRTIDTAAYCHHP
jgi:hypothetical protein